MLIIIAASNPAQDIVLSVTLSQEVAGAVLFAFATGAKAANALFSCVLVTTIFLCNCIFLQRYFPFSYYMAYHQ
jgi:Kef-type K+ transport system membrane component KefB